MKAARLAYVSLTVRDLAQAARFYCQALGFAAAGAPSPAHPGIAALLGPSHIRSMFMERGRQLVELVEFEKPGEPYPVESRSCDLWFQHLALPTNDMGRAYARLCAHGCTPITTGGPQRLPGGIIAFKFRDPDLHPLELIQFPQGNSITQGGIDHSAIAVSDAARSIAFYEKMLGLHVSARQVNQGPAQDALDGLQHARVDVVALVPEVASPHLELLGYEQPRGRPAPRLHPSDIAASRLVFGVNAEGGRLIYDPDDHAIVALGERGK